MNSGKNTVKSAPQRRKITVQLPPGVFKMALAAFFAATIPWLVVLSLSVSVYFATSPNIWLNETLWTDALKTGASLWALSYGAPVTLNLGAITVISIFPLGMSFFNIWIAGGISRRLLGRYRESIWYFIPIYTILVMILGLSVRGFYSIFSLIFGAFVISAIAAILALRKDFRNEGTQPLPRGLKARTIARWEQYRQRLNLKLMHLWARFKKIDYAYREDLQLHALGADRHQFIYDGPKNRWMIPGWVVSGLKQGWICFLGINFVGFVLLAFQTLTHITQMKQIIAILQPDHLGRAVIWFIQLTYLPVLVYWSVGWGSGAGFYQGTQAYRSVYEAKAGPIPAIPVFGALPAETPGYWSLALILLLGLCAGFVAYRFTARVDRFYHLATMLVCDIYVVVLIAGMGWYCYGSLGPQNMALWGTPPLLLAALVLLQFLLPMTVVYVLLHPHHRNKITRIFRGSANKIEAASKEAMAAAKEKLSNDVKPNSDRDDKSTAEKKKEILIETSVVDHADGSDSLRNNSEASIALDSRGRGMEMPTEVIQHVSGEFKTFDMLKSKSGSRISQVQDEHSRQEELDSSK